jgi:hypothetical protein
MRWQEIQHARERREMHAQENLNWIDFLRNLGMDGRSLLKLILKE